MYECDSTNCVKNGLPTCDRWDGFATHCFEAKPIEETEAPIKPTPFGLLERLVRFLLGGFKWYVWHWRCAYFGHKWVEIGGRRCPREQDMGIGDCYQPVYKCGRCGEQDYGDEGGPGWKVCNEICTATSQSPAAKPSE